MKYALNLSDDNRVLSATYEEYAWDGMPLVDKLPDGDIYEYLYVNGEYIHNPLPIPEAIPTEADDIAAMLIDHEYRLTLLELGISE
jgi:hypothetical protein